MLDSGQVFLILQQPWWMFGAKSRNHLLLVKFPFHHCPGLCGRQWHKRTLTWTHLSRSLNTSKFYTRNKKYKHFMSGHFPVSSNGMWSVWVILSYVWCLFLYTVQHSSQCKCCQPFKAIKKDSFFPSIGFIIKVEVSSPTVNKKKKSNKHPVRK